MKFRLLLPIVVLIGAVPALGNDSSVEVADSALSTFRFAVASRKTGLAAQSEFRHAARKFAALREKGDNSPQLHRAEGNAWLLADEIAPAIIAYHRWQRLEPDDALMSQSLSYARAQVAYANSTERAALTPAEPWPVLRRQFRRWGLFAIAVAAIFGLFAMARWVVSRSGNWFAAAILTLVIGVLLTTLWLVERGRLENAHTRIGIVVLRPEVLRSGDGFSYSPRFESPLPAGVEAVVRHQRGSWLQVELACGSIGWLPEASVGRLD